MGLRETDPEEKLAADASDAWGLWLDALPWGVYLHATTARATSPRRLFAALEELGHGWATTTQEPARWAAVAEPSPTGRFHLHSTWQFPLHLRRPGHGLAGVKRIREARERHGIRTQDKAQEKRVGLRDGLLDHWTHGVASTEIWDPKDFGALYSAKNLAPIGERGRAHEAEWKTSDALEGEFAGYGKLVESAWSELRHLPPTAWDFEDKKRVKRFRGILMAKGLRG